MKAGRLQFIGHCIRCTICTQAVINLVLWQLREAHNSGQGNRQTYIKQMLNDLPWLSIGDIAQVGLNREDCKDLIRQEVILVIPADL